MNRIMDCVLRPCWLVLAISWLPAPQDGFNGSVQAKGIDQGNTIQIYRRWHLPRCSSNRY